jgi:hypothetical protein
MNVRELLSKRLRKNRGLKAERESVGSLGLDPVPASGAWRGRKGDGEGEDFLMEHKATGGASLVVELSYLHKILREARAIGKRPVLAFTFIDRAGNRMPDGAWVAIPERDFKEMMR